MLTYLDLFSGGGGFALALRGVARPLLYAEIDEFCHNVLRKNMRRGAIPTAPIVNDIRKVPSLSLPHQPDMVVGGFPCIGISSAGLRQGYQHPQTKLFFSMLHCIDAHAPPLVVLENVGNIVNTQLRPVLKHMHARGYDMVWTTVTAYAAGLPHTRRRWFALAWKRGHGSAPALARLRSLLARVPAPTSAIKREPCPRLVPEYDQHHTQRWHMLGNAIVPHCATLALKVLVGMAASGASGTSCAPRRAGEAFSTTGAMRGGALLHCDDLLPAEKPDLQIALRMRRAKSQLESKQTTGLLHIKRVPLWATPRASCDRAARVLTNRTKNDLPTQLVFAEAPLRVAASFRGHGCPNIRWVEWLMGYPLDYTKPTSPHKS